MKAFPELVSHLIHDNSPQVLHLIHTNVLDVDVHYQCNLISSPLPCCISLQSPLCCGDSSCRLCLRDDACSLWWDFVSSIFCDFTLSHHQRTLSICCKLHIYPLTFFRTAHVANMKNWNRIAVLFNNLDREQKTHSPSYNLYWWSVLFFYFATRPLHTDWQTAKQLLYPLLHMPGIMNTAHSATSYFTTGLFPSCMFACAWKNHIGAVLAAAIYLRIGYTGEVLLVYGYRLHCRRSTYSQHSGIQTDFRVWKERSCLSPQWDHFYTDGTYSFRINVCQTTFTNRLPSIPATGTDAEWAVYIHATRPL